MRSTIASPRLPRLLGGGMPADGEAPAMDVAERLSLWLNAFDAIGLQAAQQAIRGMDVAGAPLRARAGRPPDLQADLQRVRSILARAIAQDPAADADDDAGYKPWQQRHLELQRQMEQMVGALRDHVRHALAAMSPRLRQLAALDVAMDKIVAPREQALLPAAPALLKRRFEELRAAEGGREAFLAHWRETLQAELDLRLEPVAGLVAAAGKEQERIRR